MALHSLARARTAAGGAKRNSASMSMNRLISQGQAMRSIFGCSRVIQRMNASHHQVTHGCINELVGQALTSTRNQSMYGRPMLLTVLILGASTVVAAAQTPLGAPWD